MGERSIRRIGDPILRKPCAIVPEINAKIIRLLDDLKETLYASPGRAGLAAPQLGVAKRVAVVDVGTGLLELINPVLLEQKGVQSGKEICLSIPGVVGIVKRAKAVLVSAWNRRGEEVLISGKGLLARCIQHEIDHLEGILFIDHVKQGELYNLETRQPLDVMALMRLSRRHEF